jgi:pyrimidine deaminase RibD-like protein
MRLSEFNQSAENDLDQVLVDLCEMIVDNNNEKHSWVGAAVVDPKGQRVLRLGTLVSSNPELWCHAERTAIDAYNKEYGDLPTGSIIVTTLSPCSDQRMELRYNESCTDLLEGLGIDYVYCGYMDPSQDNGQHKFKLVETNNAKLNQLCERIGQAVLARDEEHLKENFHDGRNPEDKGDSKRYNVPTKGSVSSLRKIAKQGGRRGQLAHWMANMKAGRAKKK